MEHVLYDIMEGFARSDRRNGFLPLCAPTGIGKSHDALDLVFDLHVEMDGWEKALADGDDAAASIRPPVDKVVFMSTRTALVDDVEYGKRLKEKGRSDLASQVCSVKNNLAGLLEAIEDEAVYAAIPEELKRRPEFKRIEKALRWKRKACDKTVPAAVAKEAKAIWDDSLEELRFEAEPKFRKALREAIEESARSDDGEGRPSHDDMFREVGQRDELWGWVEKAYPAVNLLSAKVVFVTLQKALFPIDTIWGGGVSIVDDLLDAQRALVVFDEFDSGKEVIVDRLVNDACDGAADVIAQFKNVKSRVLEMNMPDEAFSPYNPHSKSEYERGQSALLVSQARKEEEAVKKIVKEVYERYGLNRSVLIDGENVRRSRGLLFNAGGYRSSGSFVLVDDGSPGCIKVRDAKSVGTCPRCGAPSAMRRFGDEYLCSPAESGRRGCGYAMPALIAVGTKCGFEIGDADAARLFAGECLFPGKRLFGEEECGRGPSLELEGGRLCFVSEDDGASNVVTRSYIDTSIRCRKEPPEVDSIRKFVSDSKYAIRQYARFMGNRAQCYVDAQKDANDARAKGLPVEELGIAKAVDIMLEYANPCQKGDGAHRSLADEAMGLLRSRARRKLAGAAGGGSVFAGYYEHGFGLYSIDAGAEIENPPCRIMGYDIKTSPEAVAFMFAQKAKVIGLSATIMTETVLDNFDMAYGRCLLGGDFVSLSEEQAALLERLVDEHFRGYRDGLIEMDTRIVPGFHEIEKEFKALFFDEEAAECAWGEVSRAVEGSAGVDFCLRRYCRVAWHMREFIADDSYRAALSMMAMYPTTDGAGAFSLSVLRRVFEWMLYDADAAIGGVNAAEARMMSGEYRKKAAEDVVVLRDNDVDGGDIKAALSAGGSRFVMTTYQGFKIGVNLSYDTPDGIETVLTDYGRGGRLKDFDGIYFDKKTHIIPQIDKTAFDKADPLGKVGMFLSFALKIMSLGESREISPSSVASAVDGAMGLLADGGGRRGAGMRAAELRSVREAAAGAVAQAAGRGDRGARKTRKMRLFGDPDLLYGADGSGILERWKRKGMFVSPLLERFFSLYSGTGPDESAISAKMMTNRKKQITAAAAWKIDTVLQSINRGGASEIDIADYDAIGAVCLKKGFSLDDGEIGSMDEFKMYYEYEDERSSYSLSLDADTPEGWRNARVDEMIEPGEFSTIVSIDDFRMDELMEIPGLRARFEERGWKTQYKPSRYLLNAVMAKRILPGRLGEAAGEFILESKAGLGLERLPDGIYERFDSKLTGHRGCYVDFKFWNGPGFVDDAEGQIGKISGKMDEIGAERVAVLNILPPKGSGPFENPWRILDIGGGKKVFLAAHLVDEGGLASGRVLDALCGFFADRRAE